jgi:AraC-like DNA-binding protein
MRVESAVYGRLETTAPWGLSFDPSPHAIFGMVVRGNCWLGAEGFAEQVPLTGGDCYLLPRINFHTLRDHPHTAPRRFMEVIEQKHGDAIHYGGGGTPTTILASKFTFDGPSAKPLTEMLPPVILIRADETRNLALQTTLRLLTSELASPGPGSQVIVSRLADTVFVQAIRAHLDSSACPKTGWLRALADPPIAAALESMHERIAHSWTVAELASAAGMSRSSFAERFKELVGEAPLEYLTRWRMYQAGRLLRDGKMKQFEVANLVGYDSDGAFNKAFKRVLGQTPGEFRRAPAAHDLADHR